MSNRIADGYFDMVVWGNEVSVYAKVEKKAEGRYVFFLDNIVFSIHAAWTNDKQALSGWGELNRAATRFGFEALLDALFELGVEEGVEATKLMESY